MAMKGKLIFRYGCMNAGKSTHLLTTGYNFEENGLCVIYMKSAVDTRDSSSEIVSRIGIRHDCYIINSVDDIKRLIDSCIIKENCVLLIDEVQFIPADVIVFLRNISLSLNCFIICYGLRTDSRMQLFEGSAALFACADSIEELKSSCQCGNKAIVNGKINSEGLFYLPNFQLDLGGEDKYRCACYSCWSSNIV